MITTLTLPKGVLRTVLVSLLAWPTSWSTIIGNIEKKWVSYCSFLLHFFFCFLHSLQYHIPLGGRLSFAQEK